jgi:hypothetical protein
MPITSTVDRARQLTVHKAQGEITAPDIQACLDTFFQDPTPDALWDLREGAMSQVGREDMMRFAAYLIKQALRRPRGKTALVAPRDLEFGTLRMGMAYLEGKVPVIYNIFRSMGQARAWLDSG